MRLFGSSTLGALPLAVVTLLVGFMLPLSASAMISQVSVDPSPPTKCDPTSFNVSGYFTDGCWHYDGYDVTILPTMGPFTAYRMQVFCHREEGDVCPMVIVPYSISHDAGLLSAGPYTLFVVEVDSRDSMIFYDSRGIDFSVRDTCGPIDWCVLPGFTPPQNGCNATVFPGSPGFLTVTLSNDIPIAGAEMLIEGLQQFRDAYCASGARCGLTMNVTRVEPVMRAMNMGVDWNYDGSSLHFMLYPLSILRETYGLPSIEPGDGPIARVWLEVEEIYDTLNVVPQIPEYKFDVMLNPVAFADENGRSVPACPTFAPIIGTVCVSDAKKCDMNADGRTDVVDIVRIIKCILCPIPEGCCPPEEIARGDCNGDGVLNVTDVVCCIRHILDTFCYWCEDETGTSGVLSETATIGLSNDVSWPSEGRFVVPLTLSSASSIAGIEARIRFDPAAVSVEDVTLSEGVGGSEIFSSTVDGVLSLMVVDVEGGMIPMGDRVVGEITFACKGAGGNETEVVLNGAAAAGEDGSRLDVVLSGKTVLVSAPLVPVVRLASRPNPFHSSADITLSVRSGQKGKLAVYDVSGRLVRTLHDGAVPAGVSAFSWDGRNSRGVQVRTGIYFLTFEGTEETATRKLVLLRQ